MIDKPFKPITEMKNIPDTLPDWASDAIDDGKLIATCLDRITELEEKLKDKDCTCKHCEYHAVNFGYPPRKEWRK